MSFRGQIHQWFRVFNWVILNILFWNIFFSCSTYQNLNLNDLLKYCSNVLLPPGSFRMKGGMYVYLITLTHVTRIETLRNVLDMYYFICPFLHLRHTFFLFLYLKSCWKFFFLRDVKHFLYCFVNDIELFFLHLCPLVLKNENYQSNLKIWM